MAYIKNIKMFVRVYELGSMSAAARDQRTSPAVASSRIAELEKYLGVRLFNRTTRALHPTENGKVFYTGAHNILATIAMAEADIIDAGKNPRGTVFVAAPLGVGRRFIAPFVPAFQAQYPQIKVRLRLSDRVVDITAEGLDVAFHMGQLTDSSLKMRHVATCQRLLCAAPEYIAQHGNPADGAALIQDNHACLNLRYPGAKEFQWALHTRSGVQRYEVSGPFESDDGDVLTAWALQGHGIILKPLFEVAEYLRSGALQPVAMATPPLETRLVCLYPPHKIKEAKVQLFVEFIIARCRAEMERQIAGV